MARLHTDSLLGLGRQRRWACQRCGSAATAAVGIAVGTIVGIGAGGMCRVRVHAKEVPKRFRLRHLRNEGPSLVYNIPDTDASIAYAPGIGKDPAVKNGPTALQAWELLAESYAARVDSKPHNALYERPATLSLFPPVQGRRVLDAGCGPGVYAQWLVEHGAEVVGFDISPKMIRLAEERLQGKATIFLADFGKPLDFLDSDSFDIVLSALALVLFSAGHPFDEFYEHHPDGNYFKVEQVDMQFRGLGSRVPVRYFRRPLGAMLDALYSAGFTLERLLDPRPVVEFKDHDPKDYAKLIRQPGFICFRAKKL